MLDARCRGHPGSPFLTREGGRAEGSGGGILPKIARIFGVVQRRKVAIEGQVRLPDSGALRVAQRGRVCGPCRDAAVDRSELRCLFQRQPRLPAVGGRVHQRRGRRVARAAGGSDSGRWWRRRSWRQLALDRTRICDNLAFGPIVKSFR